MKGIRLGAVIAGLLVAGGLAAFAILGSRGSASAADPPNKDQYDQLLAGQLGITVDKLHAAETAARNQLIDQLAAQGKITPDQANKLKSATTGGLKGLRPDFRGGAAGPRGLFFQGASDVMGVVAGKLGLTPEALRQEMRGGKSLAQVGNDHGVSRDVLKTTIVNALNADLQKATASGKITQDMANKITSNIPTMVDRFLDFSGKGGPGRFRGPNANPNNQQAAPTPATQTR